MACTVNSFASHIFLFVPLDREEVHICSAPRRRPTCDGCYKIRQPKSSHKVAEHPFKQIMDYFVYNFCQLSSHLGCFQSHHNNFCGSISFRLRNSFYDFQRTIKHGRRRLLFQSRPYDMAFMFALT